VWRSRQNLPTVGSFGRDVPGVVASGDGLGNDSVTGVNGVSGDNALNRPDDDIDLADHRKFSQVLLVYKLRSGPGIRRVKGVKKLGVRLGNWLTAEQGQALWQAPDHQRLKGNATEHCSHCCSRAA